MVQRLTYQQWTSLYVIFGLKYQESDVCNRYLIQTAFNSFNPAIFSHRCFPCTGCLKLTYKQCLEQIAEDLEKWVKKNGRDKLEEPLNDMSHMST
jgi:hypothetical protein